MAARVLDYNDILLREQDVDLLKGPYWLSDQVISFYFEYLAKEKYAGKSFAFVGGSVSYFLASTGISEARTVIEVLQLSEKEVTFLVVNDNPDCESANGGSHWSLLVYAREDGSFRHYDSARGINAVTAKKLAESLHASLRLAGSCCFQPAASPVQANGHDCGIFVIAMADAICKQLVEGASWDKVSEQMQLELTGDVVHRWRTQLLQLIQSKAEAQRNGWASAVSAACQSGQQA